MWQNTVHINNTAIQNITKSNNIYVTIKCKAKLGSEISLVQIIPFKIVVKGDVVLKLEGLWFHCLREWWWSGRTNRAEGYQLLLKVTHTAKTNVCSPLVKESKQKGRQWFPFSLSIPSKVQIVSSFILKIFVSGSLYQFWSSFSLSWGSAVADVCHAREQQRGQAKREMVTGFILFLSLQYYLRLT